MTLDEFIQTEQQRLKDFKQAWLKAHSTHPNSFPMSMPEDNEGMWDESLSEFDGEGFDVTDIDDEEQGND